MTTPSAKRLRKLENLRVRDLTKSITYADASAAGTQKKIDFASALPSDAFVIGAYVDVTAVFTDGAAGTCTTDLGEKSGDEDAWIDGADITTAIAKLSQPRGVQIPSIEASITPQITVDGTVNLNTLTAGAATYHVLYVRLSAV